MRLRIAALAFVAASCFAQTSVVQPLGVFNTSAPTLTDGKQNQMRLDSSGNLLVNVASGSTGNAAAGATGSSVPAQAGYVGLNVGGTMRGATAVNPSGSVFAQQIDVASIAGTTALTGNGVTGAGSVRVTIASDNTAFGVSAAQSGNWTARTVGNAGATLDGAPAATAPTNALQMGGTFNTSPTTLTTGQMGALQLDSAENLLVNLKTAIPAGANLIGYTRPGNACSTTNYEAGMQYLPSTSTQLTATATCVSYMLFSNKDTANHTVNIQDQSTGCNTGICAVLTSYLIPPGGITSVPLYGTKFTGGIKWSADTANMVVANVIGNQ